MLHGQKLQVKKKIEIQDVNEGIGCLVYLILLVSQGVSTAREVYEVLTCHGWQELFPLLSTVHEICIGQLPPTSIVEYSEHTPNLSLVGGPNPCY